MIAENVVREVAVFHEGVEQKASYFVENDIIHANFHGKNMRLPRSRVPVEEMVKAVLIGMLVIRRRQMKLMAAYPLYQAWNPKNPGTSFASRR